MLVTSSPGLAQVSAFKRLSRSEKCWVIRHLFIAKRVQGVSIRSSAVADSLLQSNQLDKDGNGGQVDAFRHAYWMYMLSKYTRPRKALSLGKAHEKGNYQQWRKGEDEDGGRADYASQQMDLYNNEIGVMLFKKNKNCMDPIQLIIHHILNGDMKIVKRSSTGQYLNKAGSEIAPNQLGEIWKTDRCLIRSNGVE